MHCVRAAAARTFCTAGTRSAMRMAMMAITTNNSMRVKAWRVLNGSARMVLSFADDSKQAVVVPLTLVLTFGDLTFAPGEDRVLKIGVAHQEADARHGNHMTLAFDSRFLISE